MTGNRLDDYGDYSTALDRGDPNYDSEEDHEAYETVHIYLLACNRFFF